VPGQGALQVLGEVRRHEGRADAARLEGVGRVHRADERPLLVVEDGQVDRARDVVVGELRGRAHVDDGIEAGQVGDPDLLGGIHGRCPPRAVRTA